MSETPDLITEYLYLNKALKEVKEQYIKPIEKRMAEIKPDVKDHLQDQGYPQIYFRKPKKKTTFDPFKLYEFAKTLNIPDELLQSWTIPAFDLEQVDELYIRQYITDVDQIPDSCYEGGEGSGSIEIPENRQRK